MPTMLLIVTPKLAWANMAALDQFNFSEALLRPVKVLQFGVFSPEEIVSLPRPLCACAPQAARNV